MAAVRARAAATKRKTIILPRVKDFFIRKPPLASTIYPNTKNDRRNLYFSRSSKRPRALAENDYRSNNLSPISGGIAQLVHRLVAMIAERIGPIFPTRSQLLYHR